MTKLTTFRRTSGRQSSVRRVPIALDSDDMGLPIEHPGWLLNRAAEQDM